MSQDDFGAKLVSQGLTNMLDPAKLAAQALTRNRRRIRSLAALTIGLWLITFLLVPALWLPMAAKMKQETMVLSGAVGGQTRPVTVETVSRILQELLHHIAVVSGYILGIITLASLFAAISTVWLVLTVRRVTLEQLSAGLAQVSEQLRRLESGQH